MNANGARTESNNFLVDSSTVSSSQRSGVANITPNPEVVEEVRVAVNNFSAETGRNGSVLVNILTKSGSNTWHGSTSFFYTNDSLQSKNEFQQQMPGFQHPDYGRKEYSWGLGGPILKDRTFFFTSGDVLRSEVAISRAARIVTPQFIDFMKQNRPNNTSTYVMSTFPASFSAERNFLTAGQLLGSSCSGSAAIASPVGAIPCDLPVTGEGTFNTTSPRKGLQWTARIDHHLATADRIYGAINRTTVDKVLFGTPDVYPDFNTISPTNSLHFNTNWTRIVSPHMVNEASFSYVHVYGNLPLNRPDVPGIQVTGIERYQTTWGPNDFVQNNFEWRDVLSWTRSAHSLKMGGRIHGRTRRQRRLARLQSSDLHVPERLRFRGRPAEPAGQPGNRPEHRRGGDEPAARAPDELDFGVPPRRLEGQAESHAQPWPAIRRLFQHS